MTLIASLSLVLIIAHLLGWIAERLEQPALLGHMLAGIVLGPLVAGLGRRQRWPDRID
jgi:Kef-type K+ transport system membrane component KefB